MNQKGFLEIGIFVVLLIVGVLGAILLVNAVESYFSSGYGTTESLSQSMPRKTVLGNLKISDSFFSDLTSRKKKATLTTGGGVTFNIVDSGDALEKFENIQETEDEEETKVKIEGLVLPNKTIRLVAIEEVEN